VTMPKAEMLARMHLFAVSVSVDLQNSDFLTMPIEELRQRVNVLTDEAERRNINLGDPKANVRLEDQVYAVLHGRNFKHPDWHLDLEALLEQDFGAFSLVEQIDAMICTAVAEKIALVLGMTREQREELYLHMRGYGYISDHLAFDNENGVEYSDELVDEIAKTAIEAAHDMETLFEDEIPAKPKPNIVNLRPEGLEQEFNSLQAQREGCEAFI
jgi:hypothetical protein